VVLVLLAIAYVHRGGPRYTDARGARVVRYGTTVAVVPRRRGRQLIVLLHGRGSPPAQFLSNQFFAALDEPNAPVVVLPDTGDAASYWHDRRSGNWGSQVLDRVIPDARRRFHTSGPVALGGISMGGYGALHLASLQPSEFCAVGGHSAAVWTSAGATAPGAFDDAADYARNDVFAEAPRLRGIPVWLDNGADDPFRAADAKLAHTLGVPQHVWPGGHTSAYWNAHIAQYLRFYENACRTRPKTSAAM
jgi:enterochelin esterase-like enzyme